MERERERGREREGEFCNGTDPISSFLYLIVTSEISTFAYVVP